MERPGRKMGTYMAAPIIALLLAFAGALLRTYRFAPPSLSNLRLRP